LIKSLTQSITETQEIVVTINTIDWNWKTNNWLY